jgi:hypothetical protein
MLWGPHYQNWDMNLEKNTAIGERYQLQLRGEVFNVANHPNFSVPSAAVSNPASITSMPCGRIQRSSSSKMTDRMAPTM